ncbi:9630_t:CDS:2 [Rhizophagus irregularis]|nr:9630_t:CDS:2 [Rhizophagus irregularis]
MSHGRPPLKDVCKHFEKLHKLMDMDKEHLIKSIQQVQKSKQPLDKMDADKKLASKEINVQHSQHLTTNRGIEKNPNFI